MKYFEDECFSTDLLKDRSILSGSEFITCKFEGLDLNGLSLNYSKFSECTFDKCNLSNITFLGSTLRELIFHSSKIVGVNFSSCSSLQQVTFEECVLDYSVFQNVKASYFKALNSSLKEVDLSESKLINASFFGSDLHNANLDSSDLTGSDFRDAKNYFINPQYSKIKNANFSMPEAMSLLTALDINVE